MIPIYPANSAQRGRHTARDSLEFAFSWPRHTNEEMPAYTKTYFHAVWAVKFRAPILVRAVEQVVMAAIARKVDTLRCHLLAANGAQDHIHIALEIPPALAPASDIGAIKGRHRMKSTNFASRRSGSTGKMGTAYSPLVRALWRLLSSTSRIRRSATGLATC